MELPATVPVMTLPSATLFPQALLPLYIFEPRYRRMLADALKADRMFSVAMQKPGRLRESPCAVAGLGLIRVSVAHQDGTSHLILQGITRVELGETVRTRPYRVASIRPLQAPADDSVVIDALVAKVHELVGQRLRFGPPPFPFPVMQKSGPVKSKETASKSASVRAVLKYLEKLPDADQLADLVSCWVLPVATERQTILETVNLEARLKHLIHFLMAENHKHRKNKS